MAVMSMAVMSTTVAGCMTSSFMRSISVVPPPLYCTGYCTGAVMRPPAEMEASATADAASAGAS